MGVPLTFTPEQIADAEHAALRLRETYLREILLTCDGVGKECKRAALEELIDMANAPQREDTRLLNWLERSPNPHVRHMMDRWCANVETLRSSLRALSS